VITLRDGTRRILLTYIPVQVPRRGSAGSRIAQSLEQLDSYVRDSLQSEILGSVGSVVIAGLLALALGVVFIGRPINRLAEKARRVGTGDLSGPLVLEQRDEARRARERDQPDVRAALGGEPGARAGDRAAAPRGPVDHRRKLASGLAHELGTPLNVVGGVPS